MQKGMSLKGTSNKEEPPALGYGDMPLIPRSRKIEADGAGVWVQPEVHETLSKTMIKTKIKKSLPLQMWEGWQSYLYKMTWLGPLCSQDLSPKRERMRGWGEAESLVCLTAQPRIPRAGRSLACHWAQPRAWRQLLGPGDMKVLGITQRRLPQLKCKHSHKSIWLFL